MNDSIPPEAAPPDPWSRRRWIRHFMVGSVAALGANGWRGTLLADISPNTPASDILKLSLDLFPSLLDGTTPSIQLRLSSYPEIIMINRAPFNGVVHVLNSRCTHLGCTVNKWNPNDNIHCDCHGSIYDIDGTLVYGAAGPGQPPLSAYEFSYDGANLLEIVIPGLNLKINGLALETNTAANKRLRLTFNGRQGCVLS